MLVLRGRLKPGRMGADQRRVVRRRRRVAAAGQGLGAKVIGTSGSADKLARLEPLGLDVGIATRARLRGGGDGGDGQQGADLVINTVGGTVFAENIRAMAFEGRLATVGYVDGVVHAELDLAALHAKRLTLFGVSNKLRSKAQRAAAVPGFVADVLPHVAAGRIKPQIDQVFDFAQLPEAKARMEAGGHVGKIVLRHPPRPDSPAGRGRRQQDRRQADEQHTRRSPWFSACALAPHAGWAQPADYPSKPIRLVVGFAPGGAADYVARAMSDAFGKALGQPVVIDNKPGNGSSIAADIVAKAPADGYTLLIASPSSISVNPALNPKLSYTARDLARHQDDHLAAGAGGQPRHRHQFGRRSHRGREEGPRQAQLLDLGQRLGAAPGCGAVRQVTGAEMTHIPYKGGSLAIQSVMAGDTQLTFGTSPSVLPMARAAAAPAGREHARALAAGARAAGHEGSRPARLQPRVLVRHVRARRHPAGHRAQEDLRRHRRRDAAALGQGFAGARRHRGVGVASPGSLQCLPGRGRQVLGQAGEERQRQGRMRRTGHQRKVGTDVRICPCRLPLPTPAAPVCRTPS
jgi:hypothetical protein